VACAGAAAGGYAGLAGHRVVRHRPRVLALVVAAAWAGLAVARLA